MREVRGEQKAARKAPRHLRPSRRRDENYCTRGRAVTGWTKSDQAASRQAAPFHPLQPGQ